MLTNELLIRPEEDRVAVYMQKRASERGTKDSPAGLSVSEASRVLSGTSPRYKVAAVSLVNRCTLNPISELTAFTARRIDVSETRSRYLPSSKPAPLNELSYTPRNRRDRSIN